MSFQDFSYTDADLVLERIHQSIPNCNSEEDIKLVIAPILDDIASSLGLEKAEYESKIGGDKTAIYKRKKTDALYGRFIIEYKAPKLLDNGKKASEAEEQVKGYIEGKSKAEGLDLSLYFACVIDGYNILFIRYSSVESAWIIGRPAPIGPSDIVRIVEAIRGLQRKALDANLIIRDLGLGSTLARKFVKALFETNLSTNKSKIMFEEWFRTFRQVVAYDQGKLKQLNTVYGLEAKSQEDQKKLLFSIQTFFAIVMKLISAEVVQLHFGGKLTVSYLGELKGILNTDYGREKIRDLEEEGGYFQKITGIKNYLEGDFFSWYVEEWNNQIINSLDEVVGILAEYEPATSDLEPERIKDLFKLLYQNLLPKEIRHSWGEYYTPDWLADLTIEKVGLDKDDKLIEKRILDPACGSGTFIVSVIRRFRLYMEEHNLDPRYVFEKIISNVIGFDLNPIAVLASRSNYIIALGDMIRGHQADFEIPIYMADSLARRFTTIDNGGVYRLDTAVGTFTIPQSILDSGHVSEILNFMKEKVQIKLGKEDFKNALTKKFGEIANDINATDATVELYEKLLKLEKEGRNRIWINILKNSFAPLLVGQNKFDYVIGNPPWINWESLPESYREASKEAWQVIGLIDTGNNKKTSMGRVKKDIAMLFIVYSLKNYTKERGVLGMLCPYTLFKVTAGAGFRTKIQEYGIEQIVDLVEMKPFKGATTRAAMVIIKNEKVEGGVAFPISAEIWRPVKGVIDVSPLQIVKENSQVFPMGCYPSSASHTEEPWIILSEKTYLGLRKAIGQAGYRAYAGVNTGLDGAYWVKVIEEREGGAFVRNLLNIGKIKLPSVEGWVEKELIYPLARGRDLENYRISPSSYILLPHSADGKPIVPDIMKNDYPKAYIYFNKLKKYLSSRSIYKLLGKKYPFYSVFDIGAYSFTPVKVAWQYISGEISGKARLNVGLIKTDRNRVIIPNEKLMFIPLQDINEAFYVLGVLNSSISKLIVASYSIESHISTDILTKINIHKFDSKDPLHQEIGKISKDLYEISSNNTGTDEISLLQELDEKVASLYGITDHELKEIERDLQLLLNES